MVNATLRPLYPRVKKQDTRCSKVGWVGLGTRLDGYGKYHLIWDPNPLWSLKISIEDIKLIWQVMTHDVYKKIIYVPIKIMGSEGRA
jgi:hypothetical protein